MRYGSQITSSDIALVEDYVDTFLAEQGHGPEKTESVMRFIMEKKDDKESEISLKDIDPTVFPMIRKAMIRYPTAKNDLEALVKLVQDEMKKEQGDIDRLDKENDVQDDDIEGLDGELTKDTELTRSNRNIINTVLSRLDALEKNQEEITSKLSQPTQEGYGFIHEEPVNEITDNDYGKDAITSRRMKIATFRKLVDRKQITVVGKIGEFIVTLDGKADIGEEDVYMTIYKANKGGMWFVGEVDMHYHGHHGSAPMYQTYEAIGSPLMQGKGLMGQCYLLLAKKLGWVMISGDSHSPGAKKMWTRLVANPYIMAWTEIDGEKHELFYNKQTGEIDGLEGVYGHRDDWYQMDDDLRSIIEDLVDQKEQAEEAYQNLFDAGEIGKRELAQKMNELNKRVMATIEKYEKDYGYEMHDNEFAGDSERLIYFMYVGKSRSFKESLQETGRVSEFVQTDDVSAPEVATQAKKFGNDVDADGYPPTMDGKKQQRTRTKIEYTPKEHDGYVNVNESYEFLREYKDIPKFTERFWYNPRQKKIIDVPKLDHVDYIWQNPERFGIPKEKFEPLAAHVKKYALGSAANQPDARNWMPGWSPEIVELAAEYGWVRGGNRAGAVFLQSPNIKDIRRTLGDMMKSGIDVGRLDYDTLVYDFDYHQWEAEGLHGEGLRNFVKYGSTSNISQFRESEQLNEMYVTKYWIHPDQKKLIKLDTTNGRHHTQDAFEHPRKYGVSFKELGPDYAVDKYYDIPVAMIMYKAGWVRFSIEGEGYFTGDDNMQMAKAMRIITANNIDMDSAVVENEKTGEAFELNNKAEIRAFKRNGGKKPQSKMAMFREGKNKKRGSYVLQLERDGDMYVLHITQTKTGHRTEVRGKAGYEIDGYDPNDPLHQLLDKIGKAVNISDLMNGTKVSLNPVHPDYPKSKEEVVKMVGEDKVDWALGAASFIPGPIGTAAKVAGVAKHGYEFFRDTFGKKTPTPQELADKHDVPLEDIMAQIEKGTEIEKEHTEDEALANEIARDHIAEFPDYYDRLEKIEESQQLNELFDKPLPYEVIQNRDMVFKAHFMTPDGKDVQLVAEQDAFTHDKHWEVVFDVDFENKVTGGGEEFLIFSTIIAILKEFVTSVKPINIYFSSFDNSASRTSLYGKMLQRFADKMGYEFTVDTPSGQSMKGDAEFYLSRKGINESEQLNELFNETYDYEWIDKTTNGEWTGEFTPDDGKVVGFYTSEGGSNENYMNEIIFDKGFINVGITGEGDAFKILSTIVKMAKEWVASTNPINFFFDASEPSRTKLYKAMANRFAKETGYSVEIDYVGKPSLGQRVRKQPNMSQGARFIFRKNAVNESQEQLNELFNDIYDYGSPRVKTSMKSEQEAYSVEYDFNTEEHEYTVQLLSWPQWGGGPDHWSVDFYIEGGGTAITNTGNAFKVLSTVVDIIKKTINDFTIEYLYFSAKEPSRRKLYAAMVKKLAKDMGWRHVDVGDDGYFVIKQGLTESKQLNELFDKPLKYRWDEQDEQGWEGRFQTPNGQSIFLTINRERFGDDVVDEVAFAAEDEEGWDETGISGKGEQFVIFSTVLKMIGEFMKATKSQKIRFTSEHPLKSPSTSNDRNLSRTNLYKKMLEKFASQVGYNYEVRGNDERTVFILTPKDVKESDYGFFHEDVDWSQKHWNHPSRPYAKTAEMVPVAWLEKLVGNDLRTYDDGPNQNIGYNPEIDDWEYGNLADLAKSMQERGIQEPVMIIVGLDDGFAYVGEGNHRIAAAKIAGIKELPARVYMQNEVWGHGELGQHRHDMRHDITWNPEEIKQENWPKEKYYDKPSQVFKSLQPKETFESVRKTYDFLREGIDTQEIVKSCSKIIKFYKKYQTPLFHGGGDLVGNDGFNNFKPERHDTPNYEGGGAIPAEIDAVWDSVTAEDTKVARKNSLFVSPNANIAGGYGSARIVLPQDGWRWMTVGSHVDLWDILTRKGEFVDTVFKIIPWEYAHDGWLDVWKKFDDDTRAKIIDAFKKWLVANKDDIGIEFGTDDDLDRLAKALKEKEGNEVMITGSPDRGFYSIDPRHIVNLTQFSYRQHYDKLGNDEKHKENSANDPLMAFLYDILGGRIEKNKAILTKDRDERVAKMIDAPKAKLEKIKAAAIQAAQEDKWLLIKQNVDKNRDNAFTIFKPSVDQPEIDVSKTMFGDGIIVSYPLKYDEVAHIVIDRKNPNLPLKEYLTRLNSSINTLDIESDSNTGEVPAKTSHIKDILGFVDIEKPFNQ